MAIPFLSLPSTIRVPGVFVEFDSSRATQGPVLLRYKVLAIGQRLSTGTKAALDLVPITSAAQATGYFGAGSQLAAQCAAILANNDLIELWAIAVADPAGAVATGTFTVGGSVTAAGTLVAYVAGRRFAVAVHLGDSTGTIAAALSAAINTDTNLPATAGVSGSVVTITSRHAGTCGNDIDLRLNYLDGEALPTGITCAVVVMASGSLAPTISAVFPILGDSWFNVWAISQVDATNLTAIETELVDRFGPFRALDALAIAASYGTHSSMVTLGLSRNCPHLSILPATKEPTPPWEKAAAAAGRVSQSAQADPARPFKTLPLVGILPPSRKDRFTVTERNTLLFSGIATTTVGDDGVVRLERLITTYKTNAAGASDEAYLDATVPLALSYIRYDWRTRMLLKYPRHKLADDGTRFGAGQPIMTPGIGRAEAIAFFRDWEALGIVEGFEQFKRDLLVERNAQNPSRLDFLLVPNLINGLQVMGTQVSFLL